VIELEGKYAVGIFLLIDKLATSMNGSDPKVPISQDRHFTKDKNRSMLRSPEAVGWLARSGEEVQLMVPMGGMKL
jgi:hypothetical protein